MKRKGSNLLFLHLCLLLTQVQFLAGSETKSGGVDIRDGKKQVEEELGWSWEQILTSGETIVANGNVWPAPPEESSNDCLVLVTRNQIMWHCPDSGETDTDTILYKGNPGKFRGAFMGSGSDYRRMWLLDSPKNTYDELLELDTATGKILQKLVIEGCLDGHDVVKLGNSAFVVDTRHGHVIEISVPASSPPYTESSIEAGALKIEREGYVSIIKRHTGFTRADHINNVAIHPQLLISNLHGKGGIKSSISHGVTSPTRLSALSRENSEEEGRELNVEQDGFESVKNIGNWNHGIAFHNFGDEIKLISLDSKSGTLISVLLSASNKGSRKKEILWTPDENHPVLVPPDEIAKKYNNGSKIFSKGLGVQGGVAYFGVSYARAPKLRATVPETLLVAVDLASKKEMWVRTVRSNGLINQILTKSNLGKVQLPPTASVELTCHQEFFCEREFDRPELSSEVPEANHACCGCGCGRQGGKRYERSLVAAELDKEAMKIEENVNITATFAPHHQCLDHNGITKRLPLKMKHSSKIHLITSIDKDLDYIVKHLCNVNVESLQKRLLDLGDEGFTNQFQHDHGNAIRVIQNVNERFKPGVTAITLIFSSRSAKQVYHFPWLEDWISELQESILQPLGIPLNQIIRMQIANMPGGSSNINFHRDKNSWTTLAHRVHIPIVTNPDVFFLTKLTHLNAEDNSILRIKSNAGEVYEINNCLAHAVRNLGLSRAHLVIDWLETKLYNEDQNDVGSLVKLRPKDVCHQRKGFSELFCSYLETSTLEEVHDEGGKSNRDLSGRGKDEL